MNPLESHGLHYDGLLSCVTCMLFLFVSFFFLLKIFHSILCIQYMYSHYCPHHRTALPSYVEINILAQLCHHWL